ncbi:MAG: hypothetical protein Q4G14_02075 [Paracoccus sp. (in: a-proteobacteria)]|uniref:hypothetical protein n=1 Tax=Paracoccus sp. TaxID=267 RepID=UPI0026E0DFE6|nr:hypothetical protein [Paracoccus sp. (in: a-proteobacteria)]MDO5612013.1 hypothetical protein [Paracoccus sp. (in: a-proteobacteria)]
MSRVLLHPGFHKTGTKSVQQFLWANGPLIWPHTALILPARITELTRLAFAQTRAPSPHNLAALGDEMRQFIGGLSLARPGKTPRDVIISAENLIGPMPRGDDAPYPQAAAILTEVVAALRDTIAATEVMIHLSLRDQADWARSIHAHHARRLSGPRMTASPADLAADLARWPLAQRAATLTVPGATVMATDIATLAAERFGIAQPFVDFLRLPPGAHDRLTQVPHLHRSDHALTGRMLELNRSALGGDALAQAKRALLPPAGKVPA